jgi:hypothetical protein
VGNLGYARTREDMLSMLEPPRHPVSDLERYLRWLKCNKPPARLGEPARLAWLDMLINAVDGAGEGEWLKAIENMRRGNSNTFFPFLSSLDLVKRRLWCVMRGEKDLGWDADECGHFRPDWSEAYREWQEAAQKRTVKTRAALASVVMA